MVVCRQEKWSQPKSMRTAWRVFPADGSHWASASRHRQLASARRTNHAVAIRRRQPDAGTGIIEHATTPSAEGVANASACTDSGRGLVLWLVSSATYPVVVERVNGTHATPAGGGVPAVVRVRHQRRANGAVRGPCFLRKRGRPASRLTGASGRESGSGHGRSCVAAQRSRGRRRSA